MRTMCRKVKNIQKFRSLWLASLSSQELSIVGSCGKEFVARNRLGESPSSSQHPTLSTVRRKRVNRDSVECGQLCLFVEGDQHHCSQE